MQSFFKAIVAFFQSIWLFIAGLFAPPAAKDAAPTDFVIDYVRAYQYKSLLG